MSSAERIPLAGDGEETRVYYVQGTHQFYSRQRRERLKRRCIGYLIIVAIFTMALIVTISYSVSHDTIDSIDHTANLTSPDTQPRLNLSAPPKLRFVPGSGSYTLFSNTRNVPSVGSIIVTGRNTNPPGMGLTDKEFNEGLEAGRQAIDNRLLADTSAAAFPVPAQSPESRHNYATRTCTKVGSMALAATGELAATKRIENGRLLLGEPSAFGSFFDGGWGPGDTCQNPTPHRDCIIGKYRTYDGSCNRPMDWGAAMTPYRRALPPNYADGVDAPRRAVSGKELPSAREVSLKVHKPSPSSNPGFTVMLAVYGQFLDHDITATAVSQGVNGSSISCCPPVVGHPECFPVPIGPGDPVFDLAGKTCMNFVRSAPAPQCLIGPRQQLNQVTAFIDGSTVYGSDTSTATELREFSGGRLKMQRTPDNRTLLPPSTEPDDGCNQEAERLRGRYCFAAGDARANENLHLTTMHLLWARQHNRIAEELAGINPTWDDETLFQESRRIVGAQLQHITYDEFLPVILGEQETNVRDLRPVKTGHRQWPGSPDDSGNDPRIANNFAAAAFRFAHTLLPGLMMMTDAQKGTSSYVELHRMLFNPYSLYSEGGVKSSVTSAAGNTIQMTSTHVTSQLTSHLFEDPIGNATVPCGLDLVSLNIQRGRDHGLPGYTRWREYCGLGKPETFADLDGYLDPEVLREISTLYESVHDVDLYTGALAEIPKPGGLVGPTFSCLIAEQFVRLQRGDRFWYEVPLQPHSFTDDQLRELRKTSLSRLICDCSDGVTEIQAYIMRAVGPTNPMISCEDIPGPSFEAWRITESMPAPATDRVTLPIDWTELKKNINETIRVVVNVINNTKSTDAPETEDWAAFRNYLNNTFTDLRNQLAVLHPPKPTETFPDAKDSPGFSTTQTAVGPGIYQDWINFKIGLVKSLNDSIGAMSGGPGIAADWIAFRQNVRNQFADLQNRLDAVRLELGPRLSPGGGAAGEGQAGKVASETLVDSNQLGMIPAIFDWKGFKDSIISSVDEAIMSVGGNMPPPGDPAWASFESDIMNRFSELRDRMNSQATTAIPTEAAEPEKPGIMAGMLSFKDSIAQAMRNAALIWKQKMPRVIFPKPIKYKWEVIKVPVDTEDGSTVIPEESVDQRQTLQAAPPANLPSAAVSDLTADWLEFRIRMNETLSRVLADIRAKRPITMDPLAWAAFKAQARKEFAAVKAELVSIKDEWRAKVAAWRLAHDPINGPILTSTADDSELDSTVSVNPAIPAADWAAFKKEINDTLFGFLNTARKMELANFTEVHEMFNKSFSELRKDIDSLRNLLPPNGTGDQGATGSTVYPWPEVAAAWANFRAQLNSTISELVEGLRNQSVTTMGNVMKILFQAKDRLSDLEPPASVTRLQPADLPEYASGINKTMADTLTRAVMLRVTGPEASSSGRYEVFLHWFLVPCLITVVHIFLPTIGFVGRS